MTDLFVTRFFHGTQRDLRAGGLVRPAADHGMGQVNAPMVSTREDSGEYAHFTPDPGTAADYSYNGPAPDSARVYRVEPTGPVEPDPDDGAGFRSRHPARIIGEISDSGETVWGKGF